jgi:hypothetical protein
MKNIRAIFLYPPTATFRDDPDGWWSWPGTDFDAEGRQSTFMEELRGMARRQDLSIHMDNTSLWTDEHIRSAIAEIEAAKPEGVLIIQFYNNSTAQADRLMQAVERRGIPVIYYVGLGVRHGPGARFRGYRRKGLRFIMSLDNFDAIEQSLVMIKEGKPLGVGPWPEAGCDGNGKPES